MLGEIIAAIVIGIIAGYLGRALLPGDDSMGFGATVVVGIVGALVGWVLFTYVFGIGDSDKFDLGGIIGAILGTMLVLLILRAVRGRGTHTRGPATGTRLWQHGAGRAAGAAGRSALARVHLP